MISWARAVLGQTQTVEPPVEFEETTFDLLTAKKLEAVRPAGRFVSSPKVTALWIAVVICVAITISVLILLGQEVRRGWRLGEELFAAQRQVAQLLANNRDLSQQLTGLQSQRNALDEKVLVLGAQLTAAMAEVERAKTRVTESQYLSKQFNETEAYFKAQLAVERQEREAAQHEVKQLREERTDQEQAVGRLRQRLALLERDYRQLATQAAMTKQVPRPGVNVVATTEEPVVPSEPMRSVRPTRAVPQREDSVELLPIVIPMAHATHRALIQGQVADVNEAQRFIIIDQGEMDGVHEGMVFDVLHNQQIVGQATVMKVRARMAACNAPEAANIGTLHIGDRVMQRASP